MSRRWKIVDIKNLGIHINQDNVGRKVIGEKKKIKVITKEDIDKVLAKLRNGKSDKS